MAPTPVESQSGPLSPDGYWRWNGTEWVPAQPPPGAASGLAGPPAAGGYGGPAPGYGAPPMGPVAAPRPAPTSGFVYQFGGDALWSIAFGLASVLVPIFTPIYFPILPLFGLWRGYLAIRRRRIAGGIIGLAVNVLGGVVSLLASGLLFH
jgi:hypothetical protein